MVTWLGFGVRSLEVVQDVQQGQHVHLIATELCPPDVIDNHVPELFGSVLLPEKVAS
jgi:hypothetical protein